MTWLDRDLIAMILMVLILCIGRLDRRVRKLEQGDK
jgi:ABC-type enterobactin transport system permease subunit